MDAVLVPTAQFVLLLLDLVVWVLIIATILHWLIAFNIINARQAFVASLNQILQQLTQPLLSPLRRWVPNVGGLDLSPLVLILAITFVQLLIRHNFL